MKYFRVLLVMSFVISILSIAQKKSDDASDVQTKSFTVQKGGLLEVEVEPGAVRIEPWSKDEILVEAEGIDERHPDRLVMTQSGNNVTVHYRDSSPSHGSFDIHNKCSINIQCRYPNFRRKHKTK